jgi:hypothetical protein
MGAAQPPMQYGDFPPTPVLDPSGQAPPNAPGLFGVPDTGGDAPCLVEPPIGALFPQNWLRPRFRIVAAGNQNLFEIRLHAANETNDLVVYTTQTTWTMDAKMWGDLRGHIVDQPITITVRGAVFDGQKLTSGPSLGSKGEVTIAPVPAEGAIVYWTVADGTALKGFQMGEETVHDVLRPMQSSSACVGCHTSTPDGKFVAFTSSSDPGNGTPAQIMMRSSDGTLTTPSFISPSAATLLQRTDQVLPSFSKAHWRTGDRVVLTEFWNGSSYEIAWTNLEATSTAQGVAWDILPRPGDTNNAGAACFSHDGTQVAYASAGWVGTGNEVKDGDLRIVPYPAQANGMAVPVNGASDPNKNEFYPTFSPDDRWLAFGRLPGGQDSYSNALSEVFVVPVGGPAATQATRLAANDPPACTQVTSPGITNSWPKWAPEVSTVGNRTFYWLTFSSKRADGSTPQLYVTPIVVDSGVLKTYPALYLWNQPADQGNHTPAWDHFDIPIT